MASEFKRSKAQLSLELSDEQKKLLSEKLGRKVTTVEFIEPEGELAKGINGVAGHGLIAVCW
jgi:hypothetical protein